MTSQRKQPASRRGAGRPKDPAKRQIMLDAASRLFFQHGLDGVTMEAVAREAGVSKVTVYGHFGTKEGLFAEAISRECAHMRELVQEFPDDVAGLREALIHIGMGLMQFLMQPHVLAVERVIGVQGERHPRLVQAFFEAGPWAMCRGLQQQLDTMQERGWLHMEDTGRAVDQLMGMWQGVLMKEVRMTIRPPPLEHELRQQVTAAVDTFLKAYGTC